MRGLKYTVLYISILVLLTSCWEIAGLFVDWSPPDIAEEPKAGFIYEYHHINDQTQISSQVDGSTLTIKLFTTPGNRATIAANVEDGETYDKIKGKYGDTKSDWEVVNSEDIAYAESIRSIEITTQSAWDDDHPAGSSLNDIFDVKYGTYRHFVDSGFTAESRVVWEQKALAQLTESDMWFINTEFLLICDDCPDGNLLKRLYITITLDTDMVQTYDVLIRKTADDYE